jgi:hypothetical protein
MTVLQGSRVRQIAQGGWSQAAVLEGQVRFSSPTAEMDVREGTTARVETANMARFFLDPAIIAQPLDRWSEDRDKAQASPASAAYVGAAYGLADLDTAGKWVAAGDLGMAWKPDVIAGWSPYQNGHWQYYDALGYTWVSDDSWGWAPYHNGRWARVDQIGWVWQPAATSVFHPAEVYWVRGNGFAGWGPLAPGEQWNAPNPGAVVPQAYSAGVTQYAGFQPDVRTVNGLSFAPPTKDQMKTAFFVPALPSPAFLTARLDAQRPMLQVGATRIVPSVPGVTFGDVPPPSDTMTNPPDYTPPPQPASDVGIAPPPDGVYPVPAVVVPVVEVPVVIGPGAPDHPTYGPPRPTSGGSGTTTQANNPSASTGSGSKPPRTTTEPPPAGTPPAKPVNRPEGDPMRDHPVTPPVVKPKTDDTVAKKLVASTGEQDLYQTVLKDIDPDAANLPKALTDLNAWQHRYPKSSFANDRSYFFVHVYNRMDRPGDVLDAAARVVGAGVRSTYGDPQQVLQILVAASASVSKVRNPTADQIATGRQAAHELMEFLPDYFAQGRKPANISEPAWSIARSQLEDVAKEALARRVTPRVASK